MTISHLEGGASIYSRTSSQSEGGASFFPGKLPVGGGASIYSGKPSWEGGASILLQENLAVGGRRFTDCEKSLAPFRANLSAHSRNSFSVRTRHIYAREEEPRGASTEAAGAAPKLGSVRAFVANCAFAPGFVSALCANCAFTLCGTRPLRVRGLSAHLSQIAHSLPGFVAKCAFTPRRGSLFLPNLEFFLHILRNLEGGAFRNPSQLGGRRLHLPTF